MKNPKTTSQTRRLYDFFDNNFTFTEEQLEFIKETSLETGIDIHIVEDCIRQTLRYTFKELLLNPKDNVSIHFSQFIIKHLNI